MAYEKPMLLVIEKAELERIIAEASTICTTQRHNCGNWECSSGNVSCYDHAGR